jgi:hypothetical protein
MMDGTCADCGTTLPHEVIGCPPATFVTEWHASGGEAARGIALNLDRLAADVVRRGNAEATDS